MPILALDAMKDTIKTMLARYLNCIRIYITTFSYFDPRFVTVRLNTFCEKNHYFAAYESDHVWELRSHLQV